MGGVAKLFQRQDVVEKIKETAEPIAKSQSASAAIEEDRAARRRARRGGRALLSEARLSPEEGVGQQTLGAGPMA